MESIEREIKIRTLEKDIDRLREARKDALERASAYQKKADKSLEEIGDKKREIIRLLKTAAEERSESAPEV